MPAGDDYLKYTKQVEQYADFMHLDVCDGKYNGTKCFLPEYAKDINSHSTIMLDCHLMTLNPLFQARDYVKSGANIITAQVEAFNSKKEIFDFVDYVTSNNALVGLSIEPNTPVSSIFDLLPMLNTVLIMSVQTGQSGQQFNEIAVEKVRELAKVRSQENLNFKIEVDGGINQQTAKLVKDAGADIVVSGNYIFASSNKEQCIKSLR